MSAAARLAGWALALPLALVAPAASAQECARASACCQATMALLHQAPTACERLASAPAMACTMAIQNFIQLASRTGNAPPAACGGGGGGGGPPMSDPPPARPVPPPPDGDPGAGHDSPPPRPWIPDDHAVSRSPVGQVGCVLERLNGHRAILTGATQDLELRCTGIVSASGPPVPVSGAAPAHDGRRVRIQWTPQPAVGNIDNTLGARTTYHAPASVRGSQNEGVVRAVVTVTGPDGAVETVVATRTMHVINRHLRLQVNAEVVTRCAQPAGPSSGFNLTCNQTIDLDVADDFSVRGSNGRSCGAGSWSGLRSCGGAQSTIPQAQWSLTAAQGQIDPDAGFLTLHITGERVAYPDETYNGRTRRATPHPLFSRPLMIGADDGSNRSFGSLTSTPHAGGVTAFALLAR